MVSIVALHRLSCPAARGQVRGASPVAQLVKIPPANAGDLRDVGWIFPWGISPEEGNGNPLQDPCLENPTGRGAWQATAHGVTKGHVRHTHVGC